MNKEFVLEKLRTYKQSKGDAFHIISIGIFGSVVRGDNTEESDLDVIVSLEKPDLFAMVHIKEDIEKEIGCTVDVIRYRPLMNPYLKEQIDKEAVFV